MVNLWSCAVLSFFTLNAVLSDEGYEVLSDTWVTFQNFMIMTYIPSYWQQKALYKYSSVGPRVISSTPNDDFHYRLELHFLLLPLLWVYIILCLRCRCQRLQLNMVDFTPCSTFFRCLFIYSLIFCLDDNLYVVLFLESSLSFSLSLSINIAQAMKRRVLILGFFYRMRKLVL